MNTAAFAHRLLSMGFSLEIGPTGNLLVRPASRLNDELRQSIVAQRAELLDWVRVAANGGGDRASALRPLTPDEVDRVRSWDDAEIAAAERYMALARHHELDESTAYLLSDHLVLRDRARAGHRMCVECSHLDPAGRCAAARIGLLHDVPADLEPDPVALRDCPTYFTATLAASAPGTTS